MKRKIAAALILSAIMLLTGCDVATVESKAEEGQDSMFVLVERTMTWKIVYHKSTKVMYAVSIGDACGEFTLLVNPDGSPMLYEGE